MTLYKMVMVNIEEFTDLIFASLVPKDGKKDKKSNLRSTSDPQ